MKVSIVKNSEEGCRLAADFFISEIRRNPKIVLGLATGSTPVPLYRNLVQAYKAGEIDFAKVTRFNLDEYLGIPEDHEQSYHTFMKQQLFDQVNIAPDAWHVPSNKAKSDEEAAEYDKQIAAAGGVEIQLLGLGSDGHIGFNEPGVPLDSLTHLQKLERQTIEDNARLFFGGDISQVPTAAITMGIGTIMKAKRCLLLAFGERKADAVAAMVEGPVTTAMPASALQQHPDAWIIVDEAAAAKLKGGKAK